MNKFIHGLSLEQQQPLLRSSRNASILAAAGSGKTRTLVQMLISDLIEGIPASEIVAFTFTEKAAEELLIRVHNIVSEVAPEIDLTGIYIGTIHGWCLQYLSNQSTFYNFSPIDELHLKTLVSRLYDELNLAEIYGKVYPFGVEDYISDLEVFYNENLTLNELPSNIKNSIARFVNIVQKNKMMTFGDMIRYSTNLLKEHGPIGKLKSLYVDEYQDVNPAQVELIKLMAPDLANIIVVGDDLQSIYNWRGSDVERILNFPKEFNDVTVHRLTSNYRSRPEIVRLANAVAENIALRDREKIMIPGREEVDCDEVNWLSLSSESEQVDTVVEILMEHYRNGVPWNKMAILLRSVTGAGVPFMETLRSHGIPVYCPVLSRSTQFINEFLLPIFNWLRKEHVEPRNEIEEKQIEGEALALWNSVSIWLDIEEAEDVFWDSLNDWLDAIENLSNATYDVRGMLYDFLDKCGIGLKQDDPELLAALGIATQIIRSVEEIHRRRIPGSPRRTPRGVISEIYYALIRNQEDFGESLPIKENINGVLISTVHQSKGLEWPIVLIPMLSSKRFPLSPRGHGTSFPDEIAGRYGTTTEDERRLFYVAVTRAKERLYLLDPNNRTEKKRSIFLKELAKKGLITKKNSIKEIDKTIWAIAPEDLSEEETSPIMIGLSDLLLHLECGFQFGVRRVAGVQPAVGDELGFGKGLHELIQRRLEDNREWSLEEIKRQVDLYVHLPYVTEEREQKHKRAIIKRIQFLQSIGALKSNVESEVKIELPLEKGVIYGIIDSIELENEDSYRIRDWKSNIHEHLLPRYERQLQFYNYVLERMGKKVKNTDIVNVGESFKQQKLISQEVNVNKDEIDDLISDLDQSMRKISEGYFMPNPSKKSCAACDLIKICLERWKDDAND
ncbi:ATP-dependent DNA helicase [Salirhabdus sp. Marseille-P4669]|uniref:ATP-dependent DNA helicase n=1 Tax=Salirhabdus sp. Marseille-P4669 TaxID=2042310 RepID=UPI00135A7DA0|nr:ATP-dependent DNA helicase [Salirhabdus sp. Marseille-P4669]